MIAPGATIGILGGGQLGRMLAIAAAPLGYRCHIFSPEPGGPAAQVSAAETVAAYDDPAALDAFGAAVDVVTTEFENVPASALERLVRGVPVRPGAHSLRIAQNRIAEKDFVRGLGLETTPYAAVEVGADNAAADARISAGLRCSRPRPSAMTARARSSWLRAMTCSWPGAILLAAGPRSWKPSRPSSARSR